MSFGKDRGLMLLVFLSRVIGTICFSLVSFVTGLRCPGFPGKIGD